MQITIAVLTHFDSLKQTRLNIIHFDISLWLIVSFSPNSYSKWLPSSIDSSRKAIISEGDIRFYGFSASIRFSRERRSGSRWIPEKFYSYRKWSRF